MHNGRQHARPFRMRRHVKDDAALTNVTLPADIQLTTETYERDAVGATIATIQHLISRFHTEARVDIEDLAQAVIGRLSIHDNQEKILTILVHKYVFT